MAVQDKEDDLAAELTLARNKVDEALLDSINLSGALDALFDLVKSANRYMDEREASAEKNKGERSQQLCECHAYY